MGPMPEHLRLARKLKDAATAGPEGEQDTGTLPLSDSHLSVANLGGDSKGKFRKEMFTFWCQLGGTFLVADGP